jgi:AP2-associated kinase
LDRLERSLPRSPDEDTNIESNVEFLRSMEDSDPKKKDKGSKNHLKRGSLSSLGAGTKSILAGKFGDAFKRFEGNSSGPPRTPSPLKDMDRHDLTPIAGSEAVDGRSDDGQPREWEGMTPEMRREQEARMLAQEEARVAAAQAEYKQRVGQRSGNPPVPPPKSIGGVSRVASIQNKVQSLIDESTRSSGSVTRTAQGYGHYSDAAHAAAAPKPAAGGGDGRPVVPRKPVGTGSGSQVTGDQQQQQRPPTSSGPSMESSATGRTNTSNITATTGGPGRPMAPPKPTHLNKPLPAAGGRAPSPTKQIPLMPNSSQAKGISSPKIRSGGGGPSSSSAGGIGSGSVAGTEALLAVDLPGGGGSALLSMTASEKDDYIRDFQKRFPSLGAIEMVERDLSAEGGGGRSGR